MKISTTSSSSRIATRVSRSFDETIISLVMDVAPDGPWGDVGGVLHGGGRRAARFRVPGRGERGETHEDQREHAGQESGNAGRALHQLVKRRILTLRTRPKEASVAMIEEPP